MKSGFTVLEFLVVIFIMTILVSLVLISFTRARQRARDEVRIAGVQNIMLALEQYRAVCRNYPANLDLTFDNYCSTNPSVSMQLDNFISQIPPLPEITEEYIYATFAQNTNGVKCTHYHIAVVLEDDNDVFGEDSDFDSTTEPDCRDSDYTGFRGDNDPAELRYDIYR